MFTCRAIVRQGNVEIAINIALCTARLPISAIESYEFLSDNKIRITYNDNQNEVYKYTQSQQNIIAIWGIKKLRGLRGEVV